MPELRYVGRDQPMTQAGTFIESCDDLNRPLIPDVWAELIMDAAGLQLMTDDEIREYEIERAMESYAHS